jgi:hypothetical protein
VETSIIFLIFAAEKEKFGAASAAKMASGEKISALFAAVFKADWTLL